MLLFLYDASNRAFVRTFKNGELFLYFLCKCSLIPILAFIKDYFLLNLALNNNIEFLIILCRILLHCVLWSFGVKSINLPHFSVPH